jgi:hypothetical protein
MSLQLHAGNAEGWILALSKIIKRMVALYFLVFVLGRVRQRAKMNRPRAQIYDEVLVWSLDEHMKSF